MKSIIISTLVVFLIVASSFQALGAEWSEAQKEIWNLEKMYWEYLKNEDIQSYKKLLHDKVVSMRARKYDTINKHEEIDYVKIWISDFTPESYDIRPISIQLFNNVAVVCYNYKFTGKNISTGKIRSDSGRVIHTWMKQNSTWYLISLMEASFKSLPLHY